VSSVDREAWTKHLEARAEPAAPRRIRNGNTWIEVIGDAPAAKRSKYGARPVAVAGIRFDSTKEATRYQELKMLEAAGLISALELQPIFPLQVVELWRSGPPWVVTLCGVYTADFRYVDQSSGEVVVEDVKSGPTITTAYQLRKRIAEAVHGMTVREL